jgi:Leucine-rich repeat (LRR) protein
MGREKSHEDETEIDCVDRGIHTFSQLNLNCKLLALIPLYTLYLVQNDRLVRLTLSHNKLTNVPSNISELVNLEFLNLWNNHIEELPTAISALPNLKILNAG